MTFDPQALGRSRSDLAAALKEERRRAGWTQARLAKRCSMSQTKVSNIESGKLTPAMVDVELILKALGAEGALTAEVLLEAAKSFTFILTEQAVRSPLPPPRAMAMQLDRLVSVTRLPNVRLGVVPTRRLHVYRDDFGRYERYAVWGEDVRELLCEWSMTFTRQHR